MTPLKPFSVIRYWIYLLGKRAAQIIGGVSSKVGRQIDDSRRVAKLCHSCGGFVSGTVAHLGFSNLDAMYCSKCEGVLYISQYSLDVTDIFSESCPREEYSMEYVPVWTKFEALFAPCPCGGKFKMLNPPRCPKCHDFILGDYYNGKPIYKLRDKYSFQSGKSFHEGDLLKESERNRLSK